MMIDSYNVVDNKGSEYFFLQQWGSEIRKIRKQRMDLAALQNMITMNGLPRPAPTYHFNTSRYNPLLLGSINGMPQQGKKISAAGLEFLQDANISLPSTAVTASIKNKVCEQNNGSKRVVYIDRVGDLDVLCGRGGRSNHHVGNKLFRKVVSEMKLMYRNTEAKTMKTDLSRAIVDHVCLYGGRFVKKDANSGKHYLLTRAEAQKKTSQALREKIKWKL